MSPSTLVRGRMGGNTDQYLVCLILKLILHRDSRFGDLTYGIRADIST